MNKLIFGDIEVSKKEFYGGKKAIKLSNVDVNKIFVSNKIEKNNDTSKISIGYMDDISDIAPLRIILPQIKGWIKYFENGRKNMSFKIEDDSVYLKYNEIWNTIKDGGIKFHSEPMMMTVILRLK